MAKEPDEQALRDAFAYVTESVGEDEVGNMTAFVMAGDRQGGLLLIEKHLGSQVEAEERWDRIVSLLKDQGIKRLPFAGLHREPSHGKQFLYALVSLLCIVASVVWANWSTIVEYWRVNQELKEADDPERQKERALEQVAQRKEAYAALAAEADGRINTGRPVLVGEGILHVAFDGEKLYENGIEVLGLSFWVNRARSRTWTSLEMLVRDNTFYMGEDCRISAVDVAVLKVLPRPPDLEERIARHYRELAAKVSSRINHGGGVHIGEGYLVITFDPVALQEHAVDETFLDIWLLGKVGSRYPDLDTFLEKEGSLLTERMGRVPLTAVAVVGIE